MNQELRIELLLEEVVKRRASDLHLQVGLPPMLRVDGAPDTLVYSGQEVDEVYLADRAPRAQEALSEAKAAGESLEARVLRGKARYMGTCSTCHMLEGQGMASVFPPLAKSDYLMADKARSIGVVLPRSLTRSATRSPRAKLRSAAIVSIRVSTRASAGNIAARRTPGSPWMPRPSSIS